MIKNLETKLTIRFGRFFPILLLAVLLLSGCKTTKIVTETTVSNSKYQVVTLVQSAQPNYTTANASKMNISLQAGEISLSSPDRKSVV